MAVKLVSPQAKPYQALSSDEWPEHPEEGSTLHVIDTGEVYVFYDDTWEPDYRRIYAMRLANQ